MDSSHGHGAPSSGRTAGAWFLPKPWNHRPVTIYVSGDVRPLVNRVVFSMAQSLDPMPFWLEMLQKGEEPDPLRLRWIPPERLFPSERPEDLEPSQGVGNLALWSIVRSDEPSDQLAHLTDFVRLPPLIQELLGQVPQGPTLRALAVGNADRVEHLFRERTDEFRGLLEYLTASSVCLVVGATGSPGVHRGLFDAEFHVSGASLTSWRSASIVCDRTTAGPDFPVGRRWTLGELPGLGELFVAPSPTGLVAPS